jgi:hypothetical protein
MSTSLQMSQHFLVFQALYIVMERSMVPDLGWYPDAIEQQIGQLRDEILVNQTNIFQEIADQKLEVTKQQKIISYPFMEADEIEKSSTTYISAFKTIVCGGY